MSETPMTYDLGIAWAWEFDRDFVELIVQCARERNLTTFQIQHQNLEEILSRVVAREVNFRFVVDRASDEDERFLPLARHILHQFRSSNGISAPRPVNPLDLQQEAADKATMHMRFLSAGIDVPHTLLLPPAADAATVDLPPSEMEKLGRRFFIKPANTTGGGIGVISGAKSVEEILQARLTHKNDKYLVQETVKPAYLGDARAWFRVFYAFGIIIPCWWDDQTHVYDELTPEEEGTYGLERLRPVTARIHEICRLDFFSTELVYTVDSKIVAVDYVNDICDMRPRSKFRDGVPDAVIRAIVVRLCEFIGKI